jgi:amidase
MSQLHDFSALEQAALVRSGEISPVELVDHYLVRIDKLNERVGAFITVTGEIAREQARQAEQAVRDGAVLPPLHGVPIAIKDLNLTAGVRTTLGSAVFSDFVPPLDDFVVILLREAGTISLGKTTCPEFGLPCYSEPDVGAPARTPWDLERSAGGSSGGAAAAVAAGLVPFAQGSDGAGSIRIPSSVCGLFGIKVSRGRISNGPISAETSGLAWNGPIARTVRDAAAMLDVMAVPMPGDPHWAPPPAEPFLASADRDPGRLVIGRYAAPVLDVPVHADCLAAYEATTTLLADLGHEIVEVSAPFGPELKDLFVTLWCAAVAGLPLAPDDEQRLRPLTQALRRRGKQAKATELTSAIGALQMACRGAIMATAHCDAVLTPTVTAPPVHVGWFRDDADPWAEFDKLAAFAPFTAPYNMSGQPAVNVPLHWNDEGLPIGVQLVGRQAGESTLISLSAQLEAARPWAQRRPDVW